MDPMTVTDSPAGSPLEVLERVFGYDAFRGDQAEIIDTVVGGGDALVLMPTGGQVAVLPGALPGARGHRRRHLAADRADAGPGRRPRRARGAGRLPQLHPDHGRATRGRAGLRRRRARPALPRPRAARRGRDAAAARRRPDRALRHRRGPLRLGLGPRLPSRLPQPHRAGPALARVPRVALTATATRETAEEIVHRLGLAEARSSWRASTAPTSSTASWPRTTPASSCSTCCAASTPATPASSTASRASRSRRPRPTSASTASPPCPTTRACPRSSARSTSRASCASPRW